MFTPYFMLAVCLLHTVITALAVPAPLSKRFTGVQIISARSGLCIAANPGRYGLNDGVPVVSIPCDRAPLRWNINYGSGSVTLIEGGGNSWYYTDDNRIAITGGTQCLDEGDNGIQTYQCTTGNTNQIFYIREDPLPPASSTGAASLTARAAVPTGAGE